MKDALTTLAILGIVGIFAAVIVIRSLMDSDEEIDFDFEKLKARERDDG